jgi:hypothetical protein
MRGKNGERPLPSAGQAGADQRRIAVELKSFLGRSRVDDLEDALGQIVLYRHVLRLQ